MDSKSQKSQLIILSDDVMDAINLIFITVLKNLDSEWVYILGIESIAKNWWIWHFFSEQEEYIAQIFKYFKETNISDFGFNATSDYCPLSAEASENQAICTQIFATIIGVIRKDVSLPIASTASFLDEIISEALKSTFQAQILSFSRIIASIINKWKDGKVIW